MFMAEVTSMASAADTRENIAGGRGWGGHCGEAVQSCHQWWHPHPQTIWDPLTKRHAPMWIETGLHMQKTGSHTHHRQGAKRQYPFPFSLVFGNLRRAISARFFWLQFLLDFFNLKKCWFEVPEEEVTSLVATALPSTRWSEFYPLYIYLKST